MSPSSRLLTCLALLALLPACHHATETSVIGNASFALQPSGTTEFSFARETTLPNDATTTRVGAIAGHCTLGTDTVDARLEVVGGVSEGVSYLDVQVAGGIATVEANVNGKIYMADCDQAQLVTTTDRTGGTFHVGGSCPLLATAPDTVTLTADLEFDACTRQ